LTYQEDAMTDSTKTHPDEALRKGAVEGDGRHPDGKGRNEHTSLSGQLGHRDQDEMLKENDTDFPEPDAKAEHTGK
jgi:hypothetical protein